MASYDVVVIGAGPAGGSAAMHAAKAGLRTAILEDHPTAGEPVHCGECLSDLAFARTGLNPPAEAISLHVKGVRVLFPSGGAPLLTEPGVVLEKHKFEQWLAGEAARAGAETRYNSRVTKLERAGGVWKVGVASGEQHEAKVVIDASGVSAVANTLLDLNPRYDTVIGMQYEMHGIPQDGYLDFYIWPDYCGVGYLWMIPKSGGRANVGIVTNEKAKAKVYLDKFVEKVGWQNKTKVKAFGGLIPAGGPFKTIHTDGLMMIGDAAGFTSPLFEGGTQLGLVSGRFAAETAAESIKKGDVSAAGLAAYETRCRAEFPDYAKLLKGKKTLYSFSNSELDAVASLLPKELGSMSPLDKAVIGVKILAKHPGLLQKGVVDALTAFGFSRAKYYGW